MTLKTLLIASNEKHRAGQDGFTILELLVVLLSICILTALIIWGRYFAS